MITVKQDAEWMTNMIPAAIVPAEKHFVAFRDSSGNPGLFTLGQNYRMNVVLENYGTNSGVPKLLDIADVLKIDGLRDPIVAFHARQSHDLKLNIAIATDIGNNKSNLYLISGISPENLERGDGQYLSLVNSSDMPYTHDVFISDFNTVVSGKEAPMVFLAFQPADKIDRESQLGFVKIVDNSGSLSLELQRDWKLATNPERILSVAFGTHRIGQGVFVLYETTVGRKIQFRTFYGNDFVVEPICPPGASCITSFVNPHTKHSVLLVGGDAITQFTEREYVSPTATGTTIVPSMQPSYVRGIHTSVAGSKVSIWFTKSDMSADFYTGEINALSEGRLVNLLPPGRGGRMSGLLELKPSNSGEFADVEVNSIFSSDDDGNLTLLQQASDSRIWQSRSFWVSTPSDVLEIAGHTMRIKVSSDDFNDNADLPGCQLRLTSSGYLRALVNGKITTITRESDWYTTDSSGVLTIISEQVDLATPVIYVDKYRPPAHSPFHGEIDVQPSGVIDATSMLTERIRNLNADRLWNAKDQNGDYIIDHSGGISRDDVQKAADCIPVILGHIDKKLQQQREALRNGTFRKHLELGVLDDIWDAFDYVEQKARDAVDWTLNKIEDGVELAVELANKVYKFAATTAETIKKGLSWIFARIGVGIKKIINWIGFIFNWEDILTTSDNIIAYFDAGLGFCENKLEFAAEKVDEWAQNLRDHIRDRADPETTPTVNEKTVDDDAKEEGTHKLTDSVPFNWAGYQLGHVGLHSDDKDQSNEEDANSSSTPSFISALFDLIKQEWEVVKDTAEAFSSDLFSLVASGNWDSQKILNLLKDDIMDGFVRMVTNIVTSGLKFMAKLIAYLREDSQSEINIPVFTSLWKKISHDRPLSLANFFALLIAIPCTVTYKALVGKAPPKLQGRLTAETLAQQVAGPTDDNPSADFLSLATDMALFTPLAMAGAALIANEIEALMILPDSLSLVKLGKEIQNSIDIPWKKIGGVLKGVFLKVVQIIFNLPVWTQSRTDSPNIYTIRWVIWSVDSTSKIIKIILKYFSDIDRSFYKKITSITSLMVHAGDFPLSTIVAGAVYIKDNQDPQNKYAKAELGLKIADGTFKVTVCILGAVAAYNPDPRIKLMAKWGKRSLTLYRLIVLVILQALNIDEGKPFHIWPPGWGGSAQLGRLALEDKKPRVVEEPDTSES